MGYEPESKTVTFDLDEEDDGTENIDTLPGEESESDDDSSSNDIGELSE